MRVGWRLCSPALSQLLRRRVTGAGAFGRTSAAIADKPVTKVQTIVIKATAKVAGLSLPFSVICTLYAQCSWIFSLKVTGCFGCVYHVNADAIDCIEYLLFLLLLVYLYTASSIAEGSCGELL